VHGIVPEGDERLVIVEADDWRTKVAKETRDEARRVRLVPVLAGDMGMIHEIVAAAKSSIAQRTRHSVYAEAGG
jgi:hypothetical protein